MTNEEIIDFCEIKGQLEPENKDIYDAIIKALRKYQKIAELYDYWRSGKCKYTISCMENIGTKLLNLLNLPIMNRSVHLRR